MSLRDLMGLFQPKAIALIGDEATSSRLAEAVQVNLAAGGFAGPIAAAGPGNEIAGIVRYPTIEALPTAPDLAIVCLPVERVPEAMRRLAVKGVRAALVIGGTQHSEAPALAAAAIGHAAHELGMRLIGPDCFGIMVPRLGLNASVSAGPAPPAGKIGLVVQSTTLGAAALDWARSHDVGFSAVIGLGHALDVDFGDALDFLGADANTGAILMLVESIRERRDFIAAARATARIKPILAMKIDEPGKTPDGYGTHAGRLAGTDAVYDAVFRRAGILRVQDMRELFMAAETLVHATPVRKGGLTILANGRGVANLAADELQRRGGHVATLLPETELLLRHIASGGVATNPINLGIDAAGASFGQALTTLLAASECETILALHSPTALGDAEAAAESIAAAVHDRRASVIACWTGQRPDAPLRQKLHRAGIPTYETPADAVRAYVHLADHRRNQDMLMETPPSVLDHDRPDTEAARRLVARSMAQQRFTLSEPEAKTLLAAYGIPSVATEVAADPAAAGRIARRFDTPVAVKILSPDIVHKSTYGGVMLDLPGPFEVEKACHLMRARILQAVPGARVEGFTVQPMARRPGAVEIMIGVATDPVFGPIILFGQGGVAVEAIGDVAVGLPPLNMTLARELVSRARVLRLLRADRGHPPADLDAVCLALVKVSQLLVDIPEIVEMDVNPLFANAQGVLALDARVGLAPAPPRGRLLAIRPYPKEFEEYVTLRDKSRVLLRPIRPEDEPNHHALIARMNKEDLRYRFFSAVGELPHAQMARMTQIDYVREMAFVAVPADRPERETLGVVRVVADADNDTAEYAILVRSDLKRQGLGRLLMEKMIRYCRGRGLRRVIGEVLAENVGMLLLAESVGFRRLRFVDGDVVEVVLDLTAASPPS
jgi:acetyltransferase